MAIQLKTGKTYTSIHGEVFNDTSGLYGVIDFSQGNKCEKEQVYIFQIFRDETSRDNKKTPLYDLRIVVDGSDFDIYFSTSVLDNDNIYKQSYLHLLTETSWGDDWESDE